MTATSTSAAYQERVHEIVRQKSLLVLGMAKQSFAGDIAAQIRLGQLELSGIELDGENDTKPTRSAQATITCHLEVTPACCNIRGNAHGGFLAWLVDQCSSLSLLALSGPGERWISSGVSTNLNVNYISAAPVGTKLAITTSVLQQGRVTGLLETRIVNEETGKLVCFATHVKQDPVGGAPFPSKEKLAQLKSRL
ncbi:hypothetical protein C6P46_000534 [Rhodotorula mucilaginosa]|uniref:Thioesterase domain-containing protein n=1 Tax=Rhodotorula mucilaginosa TaxID=5537 RepID=A0A9P6VUD5_RHOMI|nr:hypothetical protein C6P46_000534 [Rhodotorula mucilaginosa]TKA57224.1 hypothetical protein B0A53_01180 [Rhodotorula sp. CCFEE 5036]